MVYEVARETRRRFPLVGLTGSAALCCCHSLSRRCAVTGSDSTCGRQAFMPIVLAQESRRVVATGPGCPC